MSGRARLVQLALAIAVTAAGTQGGAYGPGAFPEARLRADFAQAFGIGVDQVVEVRGFDLTHAGAIGGFIVGRYHEQPERTEWTFPGLVVYAPCKGGTCLYRVRLGSAAARIVPLALVDLDAPRSAVATDERWHARDVPEPEAARAAWPALLVATEGQQQEPRTVALAVVSLRWKGDAPMPVVLRHALETRWLERDDEDPGAPRPATATFGTRVEGLVFEHDAKGHRAIFTQRAIDSRMNPCLRSESYDVPFDLEGTTFRERPGLPEPPRPCH